MIFVPSFLVLVFFVLLFFLGYHFYLLSKPQSSKPLISLIQSFFGISPKATLSLLIFICLFFILFACYFGYYFYTIIPILILLNLFLKSPYLVYLIHLIVLVRLFWFFSPLWDIYLMVSFYRSFACVFSLFAYLFFIYHHKVLTLWASGLLRLLLIASTGDVSLILAGGGITLFKPIDFGLLEQEYLNYIPTTKKNTFLDYTSNRTVVPVAGKKALLYPLGKSQMFFDTIADHKYAAIAHEIKSYGKPPVIFKNNLLPLWERVHFGEKTPITVDELAYFLKYGPHSRLFSNYEILAKAVGKDNLIVPNKDYYETIHKEHSENLQLVYPIKNLVELDWVAAQANEEFIAAKAAALKYFPGEQVTIARGYKSIDFVLTGESGKKLYLDVTSLADKTIEARISSMLEYKLNKLPFLPKQGDTAKLLLYNFAYNSEIFLNAPKLDTRILNVENRYVQKVFDSYNLNIDFLKPIPKPTGEFFFQQTPVVETYAIPREEALKRLIFPKK